MTKLNIILLTLGGILNILGALFHYAFWFLFNWKENLSGLSTQDRNIMLMLNFCLATFFLLTGVMAILFRKSLTENMPGRTLLFSLGLVYVVRLVLEIILPDGTLIMSMILGMFILCFFVPAFFPAGADRGKGFSFR